jgi:hypothetical protein
MQKTWVGGAKAIAQIATITINTATNGDTYSIILTDELGNTGTITFTAGVSDTTTTIATGLFNLAVASLDPRFEAVTATNGTATKVVLTASTAGVPFYASLGGTGSGLMTLAATQGNSGPNDWNTADNWVENAVPVGGDNVLFTGSAAILYGLTTGLTLGAVANANHSGAIGQYGQYLSFICTSFNWSGTGLAFINLLSSAIAPNVTQTASGSAPNSGLYLLGSALTTLTISGNSSVDLAGFTSQTSTVTTVQLIPINNASPRVNLGTGVTLTSLYQIGGVSNVACASTSLIANAGTVFTTGTGIVGTMTNNGATITSNSSGTITTLNANAGTTDFTQSQVARTVTTANLGYGKSAEVLFDSAVMTFTNKFAGSGRMTLTAN